MGNYDVTDVVGQGQAQSANDGVTQGIWEQSAVQQGRIGARRMLSDGRVYYYAHFLGAVPAGKVAAVDASTAVCAELAATALKTSAGSASADYASSNNITVLYLLDTDLITGANSDNVFAGGYLCDHTDGHMYKIRDNDYTATSSLMKVTLYDAIRTNIDSEHELSLTGHPYNNLVIATNAADTILAGVPNIAVSAGYFAWVQTWGVCCTLIDADTAVAAGTIMQLSDDDDGAVQTFGGASMDSETDIGLNFATEPIIGFACSTGTDQKFGPVFLQIAP